MRHKAYPVKKIITILATGGTIAGLRHTAVKHHDFAYEAGALCITDLLQQLPSSFHIEPQHLLAEQIAQVDSKDMDVAVWNALARRCLHHLMDERIHGIVITHGTDTMEETAWFLHRVLPATPKPVILVGAMRPADSPQADGPHNLADALTLAQNTHLHGVLLAHAGQIHFPQHVFKAHPWRLDAFSSGDASLAGRVTPQGVELNVPDDGPALPPTTMQPAGLHRWYCTHPVAPECWPDIAIISSHAQASARMVHALQQAGFAGVVVAGTGNGTVHANLLDALQQAQQQGMAVRLCSRCPEGSIAPEAQDARPFPVSPLSAWKARIDLALELLQARHGLARTSVTS